MRGIYRQGRSDWQRSASVSVNFSNTICIFKNKLKQHRNWQYAHQWLIIKKKKTYSEPQQS